MSELIDILEKRIYVNKPHLSANAQYNYGRVNVQDPVKLLGKKSNNVENMDSDLYTKVETKLDTNIFSYPKGLLNGYNSKIEYVSVTSHYTGTETDDGVYYSAGWAFYMWDGSHYPSNDTYKKIDLLPNISGNEIKSGIGTGDSFEDTYWGNMIGYRDWGYQTEWHSLSNDVMNEQDLPNVNVNSCQVENEYGSNFCGRGLAHPDSVTWGNPFSKRFHLSQISSSTNTYWKHSKWNKSLLGNYDGLQEDNILLITRTRADEKEYAPLGHGWGGLGGGYKNDERDRIYAKTKVKKSELYEIWKNHMGQTKAYIQEFNSTTRDVSLTTMAALDARDKRTCYRDTFGNHEGHGTLGHNSKTPVNILKRLKVQVKAPSFHPKYSIKSIEGGGMKANWILKDYDNNFGWWCLDRKNLGEPVAPSPLHENPEYSELTRFQGRPEVRMGLHPRYKMDWLGWPDDWYVDADADGKSSVGGRYIKSDAYDVLRDGFRPISFVSASSPVDVQSYYDGVSDSDLVLSAMGSAPNEVKLTFKIAEAGQNSRVSYVDPDDDEYYKDMDYYFFVTNWDWKDGDPGGGECEGPIPEEVISSEANPPGDPPQPDGYWSDGWGGQLGGTWIETEGSDVDTDTPPQFSGTGECLSQMASDFPKTNSELEAQMEDFLYVPKKIGGEYRCKQPEGEGMYPWGDRECNKKLVDVAAEAGEIAGCGCYCSDEDYRSEGACEANGGNWICEGVCELYDDEIATYSYLTPGVKIIKAMVFSTRYIDEKYTYGNKDWGTCNDEYDVWDGQKDACENIADAAFIPRHDYKNYLQAVHWHLVTIRINLTADGAFPMPDFADTGGEEYTYIPYPDSVILKPYTCLGAEWDNAFCTDSMENGDCGCEGNLDENLECDSNWTGVCRTVHGYPPSRGGTATTLYQSSHPVISGLSSDSQYLNALETIIKHDKFGLGEVDDKQRALRANSLTSRGKLDELGDFLGKSDISQVRYFNSGFTKRLSDFPAKCSDESTKTEIECLKAGFNWVSEEQIQTYPLDLATFLEIPQYSSTEQSGLVSANRLFFHHHDSIFDEIDNPSGYWRGSGKYTFPNESPVGDIFISEYDQSNTQDRKDYSASEIEDGENEGTDYKNLCLFEFNCGTLDGKTIQDSSGNGNKGILIGDYSIRKDRIGESPIRDSFVKVSKTQTDEGAF